MSEEELRRLAELMTEVSGQYTQSVSAFWQPIAAVVVGFISAFLTNIATRSHERRQARREELRTSRTRLYRALLDYRMLLVDKVNDPKLRHRALARVREAIDSTGDIEYAQLLREPIYGIWPVGLEEERAERVLKVILKLENEAITVTERFMIELSRPVYKGEGRVVIMARKLEKLLGRLTHEDGFLVSAARRLPKFKGRR